MGKIAITVGLFVLVFAVALFARGKYSRTGEAVGLEAGTLARCPDKPNCVCSEYPDAADHYLAPLDIPAGLEEQIMPLLKTAILETGGRVESEEEAYIAATFTSTIFQFVDDVELRFDRGNHRVQIRSASRVGYSDFGANRKRAEQIRGRVLGVIQQKGAQPTGGRE